VDSLRPTAQPAPGVRSATRAKLVTAALLFVLWLAIIWLLFTALVDPSGNDRTLPPRAPAPASPQR
jgi:hypothetical protein